MVDNCLTYAKAEMKKGRHIIGITCEYTPRELIMAANGVPVSLCGGSAEMIPPAEAFLPANLCPLIKSTFGFSVEKANPFLEMAELVVAETTCDGKKKMYELLAETRPVYMLELPQRADTPDAMEYWVSELRKLRAALEVRFDVEITDEKLREAILTMNGERELRRELASLMKAPRPPLTGRELLDMKSLIACIPDDAGQYRNAIKTLPQRSPTCRPGASVRVLVTGVPMPHGAERVLDIIEENGGLVVCQENCTGLKPIAEDVDSTNPDPLRAIAEKYIHLPCSVMTPNTGRFELLRSLVAEYRPDCIIEVIWQACLTYDVEAHKVKRLAEKELGLAYLRVETDYSPSDSARIAMRVQALFETVRERSAPQ